MKKRTSKASKGILFKLSEDQYNELKQRANESGRTITAFMKQILFEDSSMNKIMIALKDMRDSLCNTEDITRQINQDTLRMLRMEYAHWQLTKHFSGKVLNVTDEDMNEFLSQFNIKAKNSFPDRPDEYVKEKNDDAKRNADYARRAIIRGEELIAIKERMNMLNMSNIKEVLRLNEVIDIEYAKHHYRIGTPDERIIEKIASTLFLTEKTLKKYAERILKEVIEAERMKS